MNRPGSRLSGPRRRQAQTPDYDLVVIGLGPAGARAAAVAAGAGLRVLALERRRAAGLPVQCAELVPALLDHHAGALGEAAVQSVGGMHTYTEHAGPDVSAAMPGIMLDRARFDAALAARARGAGAECRFGVAVHALERDGNLRLVDGSALAATVVIGADGPRSLVGRAIGQAHTQFVHARQVCVPLRAPHAATDVFLSADYTGGYGWLFPKGDVANVGVAVSNRESLPCHLADLLNRLAPRIASRPRLETGGLIPVSGLREPAARLGATLVLLAGDAAGLAHPVTGAGIHAALVSGSLAGAAAAHWVSGHAEAGQAYVEELTELYTPSFARAQLRRRELWEARSPTPAALRAGWVAYPDYWRRAGGARVAA